MLDEILFPRVTGEKVGKFYVRKSKITFGSMKLESLDQVRKFSITQGSVSTRRRRVFKINVMVIGKM